MLWSWAIALAQRGPAGCTVDDLTENRKSLSQKQSSFSALTVVPRGAPAHHSRNASEQIRCNSVVFRHPRRPPMPTIVCPEILNLEEVTWYRHSLSVHSRSIVRQGPLAGHIDLLAARLASRCKIPLEAIDAKRFPRRHVARRDRQSDDGRRQDHRAVPAPRLRTNGH